MRTEWVCDVCDERFSAQKDATDHEALHGIAFVMIIGEKKYISRHAYIWHGENQTLRRLPGKKVAEATLYDPDDYPSIPADDKVGLMRYPIGAAKLPPVKIPEPEEKK